MKLIVTDMDGTLLNSMIYWYESGARIIKDYFNDPKVVDKIKEIALKHKNEISNVTECPYFYR